MSDFVFMVDKTSYAFVNGSQVVNSVTGQDLTQEELGGGKIHSEVSD